MRELFLVAKFTIKDMIKRKSFIISNIIIWAIIIILFNVPNILKMINGDDETSLNTSLLIVDKDNIFENSLEALNDLELGYEVTVENKDINLEQVKERINNEEIEEAIIVTKKNNELKMTYIVENLLYVEEMPEHLVSAISSIYTNLQISKLGLTGEQLASISPNFTFELEQAEEEKVQGDNFVMMLLSLVLFYAIYFCAYQVSTSITTEKTSKIIETLVTSTTPRTIVLGKTIGIGIVGLLQIAMMIIVALISNALFLEEGMLDGLINLDNITPFLGFITAIYFILGYSLFALIYALTGSTVSKPEDVQSANGPVAIIAVIGFYLAYFTMMNPTDNLNKVAGLIPISSPFCMPFRIMMGLATTSEILFSIAILLVTIFVIANISIKIYSRAILNYGSKSGLKDMIRMYKEKN